MTDEAASRRGRNSRYKGAVFERFVAGAMQGLFPEARRSIGQARTGADAPDVTGTPFWIECGFGTSRSVSPEKKLVQAEQDSNESDDPRHGRLPAIAITKRHAEEAMVTMRLETFMGLLRRAAGRKVRA